MMYGVGMGLGWIVGIVLLGLIIWITIRAGRQNFSGSGKSALDILKERYAKGEIDKDEFEERKKNLM